MSLDMLKEETYWKLGASHIQDGCYIRHIEHVENTSAITTEQMARLSQKLFMG
jgi:hypothetical protein